MSHLPRFVPRSDIPRREKLEVIGGAAKCETLSDWHAAGPLVWKVRGDGCLFFFTVAVRPTILELQQCPRDDGLVTLVSVPEYTCYLTQWHTGYPFQVVPTGGC